jgi:hypothetical protein
MASVSPAGNEADLVGRIARRDAGTPLQRRF